MPSEWLLGVLQQDAGNGRNKRIDEDTLVTTQLIMFTFLRDEALSK